MSAPTTEPLARQLASAVASRAYQRWDLSGVTLQRAVADIVTPNSGHKTVNYEDEHFKSGADGTVHWGTIVGSDERVVVKKGKGDGGKAALLNEIDVLISLGEHASIVPVVGWNLDSALLVLKRAEGSLVSTDKLAAASFEKRIAMAVNVLDGLVHMHALDWSHGDLNLKNVLVFGENVTLTDFGAAKKPATPDAVEQWLIEAGIAQADTRKESQRRIERTTTDRAAMAQVIYNIVLAKTDDAVIPVDRQLVDAVRGSASPVPVDRRAAFIDLIRKHRGGMCSLDELRRDLVGLVAPAGATSVAQVAAKI